jgi:hypothetical protein
VGAGIGLCVDVQGFVIRFDFAAPIRDPSLQANSEYRFDVDRTIFIDPMMGSNASPIAPFRAKRFTGDLLNVLKELPTIDVVLLSLDHYDHLDLDSIDILMPKTEQFICSLVSLDIWSPGAVRLKKLKSLIGGMK